jgi:hypothetical protein
MNHLSAAKRPARTAVSARCGMKPAAATATKATAPAGVDHLPATAMADPITVKAQMLMAMASARRSPASRTCDLRAQPRPGRSRQAVASKPKRSTSIRPVATRKMTPIATTAASANKCFFVNRRTFAQSRSLLTPILSALQCDGLPSSYASGLQDLQCNIFSATLCVALSAAGNCIQV